MSIVRNTFLYLFRYPVRTIIIALIIAIILFGELLGFGLNTTAVKGRQDAYIYNGFALRISGDNLDLTYDDYGTIEALEHVTGVAGHFKEIIVTPINGENVKEHTGIEPEALEDAAQAPYHSGNMVLVAMMNIPMYDIFRREKSVSLVDGVFPDSSNKGVLIENRFARLNQLSVGDTISFYMDDLERDVTVEVCGIYFVDSDFEILESNTTGEGVYVYSPYNSIYMDYLYASELIGFSTHPEAGCTIYVDDIENVDSVAQELKKLYGEDITIYDNTTSYLENECRIIGIIENISQISCFFVFTLGSILILITFSFFFNGFKRDVGIYMSFGESKGKCFARYVLITFSYIIAGLFIFVLLYLLFSKGIINLADRAIGNTIGSTTGSGIAPYRTPDLRQGFSVSIEKAYIINKENIIKLLDVSGCCFVVSFLIPLYSIIKGKPRQLMNSSEA